jgi:hypothetical protein
MSTQENHHTAAFVKGHGAWPRADPSARLAILGDLINRGRLDLDKLIKLRRILSMRQTGAGSDLRLMTLHRS